MSLELFGEATGLPLCEDPLDWSFAIPGPDGAAVICSGEEWSAWLTALNNEPLWVRADELGEWKIFTLFHGCSRFMDSADHFWAVGVSSSDRSWPYTCSSQEIALQLHAKLLEVIRQGGEPPLAYSL